MKDLTNLKKSLGVFTVIMAGVSAVVTAIATQEQTSKVAELIDKVDKLGKEDLLGSKIRPLLFLFFN